MMRPMLSEELISKWSHLINMGSTGHYPLFELYRNELTEMLSPLPLSGQEEKKFIDLMHKLTTHQSIERKKIAFSVFNELERRLFIRGFSHIVENYRDESFREYH